MTDGMNICLQASVNIILLLLIFFEIKMKNNNIGSTRWKYIFRKVLD